MYPHRIFITGDGSFNNFFLFSYYLENYVTDQSALYTLRQSVFDPMADVFASGHNLSHLNCNLQDLLNQADDKKVLFKKIAKATDLLLIYGNKQKFSSLIQAFDQYKKEHQFIDVFPSDIVTVSPPKDATISFSSIYGEYLDRLSQDKNLLCYKFLSALTKDLNLLTLVIQHKKDVYAVENDIENEIAQNLYWIYQNQYASLVECRKRLLDNPQTEDDPHLLTAPYDWKYDGESVPIYTGTGLQLARRYHGLVKCNEGTFVEIADKDMLKSHVYKALRDQEENEDDNVKLNYHTSDHQSYPLFYQAYHFDGSPIKLGYWYINPRYVKVK